MPRPFVRMLLNLRAAVVLALVVTAAALPLAAAGSDKTNVTLLVFSDLYDIGEKDGRGGLARIASVIAAERAKSKNVFVAFAGDAISPSLLSSFDHGVVMVDLLNAIAPDVFVPGNHEFDFGEAVFRARMAEATFPLLAANLRQENGALLPGFRDHMIVDKGGIKLGIFGLTDDESARKSNSGKLTLSPSIPAAKEQAALLRKAGAELVVAVSHSSWQDDIRLANLGVLDVVLSGHDHNLTIGFDGRTLVAETLADGGNVVAIDLEIGAPDESGKRPWWPRIRIIDTADVTPDAVMAKRVAAAAAALDKDLDIVAGTTATALDSRKASVRGHETAIGNFVADAIRAATGADVAIVNGGGLRGDRQYPAGSKLTRKDLFNEMPFGNKAVLLEVSGRDLRDILENAVRFAGKGDGRFGQISGMRITGRKDAVPGSKLTSIEIGGAPLDEAKLYKVATSDFMASGKEGYDAFSRGKVLIGEIEGKLMVSLVIEAIEKAGTIAPAVEGRIVLD